LIYAINVPRVREVESSFP